MADPKKPDFSNVQSGASSTAPEAKKADFGNVQSGVESTASFAAASSTQTLRGRLTRRRRSTKVTSVRSGLST